MATKYWSFWPSSAINLSLKEFQCGTFLYFEYGILGHGVVALELDHKP